MRALAEYDISADRGFLCKYNAGAVTLRGALGEASEAAQALPRLLPSGQVRQLILKSLPDTISEADIAALSEAEARMAMVHYAFMVQAYVWGEPDAPGILPAPLARPITWLADRLGQPPLLPYSGYVLDNWDRFDRDGPISLDNIWMVQSFLSGMDEAWFVLIHVAIEARAGNVLAIVPAVLEAAAGGGGGDLRSQLEAMAGVWDEINALFDRMPERCDPYIYFERVRPYIHGWKDNPALPRGLIYEGVERFAGEPQAFRGQTGSQSSIVPTMDALLGVGHAGDPLKTFLDELHVYRPPAHRRFIEDVRAASSLRALVERACQAGLTEAYNANIQAVADFRSRHLEYAASYIHKQNRHASGNDTDIGTGGTPFMRYLKKHRDETAERLLPL